MKWSPSSSSEGVPVETWRRIVVACEEFENSWPASRRSEIERYLEGLDSAERGIVLRELVALELSLRSAAGDPPQIEEYVARFPEDLAALELAFASSQGTLAAMDSNDQGGPHLPRDLGATVVAEPGMTMTTAGGGSFVLEGEGAREAFMPLMLGRYHVIRLLGKGSFGRVYLARDVELNRDVAIKVPTTHSLTAPGRLEAILMEGRLAAGLQHPGIVRVYDVGRDLHDTPFIVLEYVPGMTLADLFGQGRLPVEQLTALVIEVAEIVHHAHISGLIHRDLKPSNILMDILQRPRVTDFGLAMLETLQTEADSGEVAGTPAYMAPEQIRGETHRFDSRTDIWALGVLLYEGLTGRLPFSGHNRDTLFVEILHREPKPIRQIDDTLPAELERICLRCLAKRMTDRFATAADVAENLRDWLLTARANPITDSELARRAAAGTRPASARVIPKGLRSFDASDANFFLSLLPGPRDREGLPETLRFWKARIKATDPGKAFRVGLIYGPSGCGKSSLVRAGLLPRLDANVRSIYVEATPEETEVRLSNAIQRVFPESVTGAGLVTALADLRNGRRLGSGEKVLIVIDQFEQWLHAHRNERDGEMVAALRQCDGEHVQAIIMVRDDFWMATTRFMRRLEIQLIEGENTSAVDLFDRDHSEYVLALFGRAFGILPEWAGDDPPEARAFLEQAVAGLARDNTVIPVRLSLFAQMVKSQPWTPATLKTVGGTQGIGMRFLEETFCSPSSPAKYRLQQGAAQAVLRSLLPESGTDIKGQMRSDADLQHASGFAERGDDFQDLIRTLEGDLRLISPTDPEGLGETRPSTPSGGRYYQLTHDYLVPSLREWLNRKQSETPRGRAGLRLAEQAALWNSKPQQRLLPSIWEWANILLLTRARDWNDPQRRMMRRAGRVHGFRLALLGGFLGLGLLIQHRLAEGTRSAQAMGLVQQVLKAETTRIAEIVRTLPDYRRWTDPELQRILSDPMLDYPRSLRASLALLPADESQVESLAQLLLKASPAEFLVIRDALEPYGARLAPEYWKQLGAAPPDDPKILPLAGALARFEPGRDTWKTIGPKLASAMVRINPVFLGTWLDALRPVREPLRAPLAAIFLDSGRPIGDREAAAELLSEYASDAVPFLADLMLEASAPDFQTFFARVEPAASEAIPLWERELNGPPLATSGSGLFDAVGQHAAYRRARAAIALLRVHQPALVWPLLRLNENPLVRSAFVTWLRAYGADPAPLISEFERVGPSIVVAPPHPLGTQEKILFDSATSTRRALILALGTFDRPAFAADAWTRLSSRLLQVYETDPDAGVHGAAEWALRRWGQADQLVAVDLRLRNEKSSARRWSINEEGQCYVIIGDDFDFAMGAPLEDPERKPHEIQHRRLIHRRFAVASKEITVGEYQRYLDAEHKTPSEALTDRSPGPLAIRNNIDWYEAVAYCNWLSRRAGLKEVYIPNDRGEYAEGMTIRADALQLDGYRLPTDAEWEYAYRAGTRTSRSYGSGLDLLQNYGWTISTSGDHPHAPAELMPNDYGLFDMMGNAIEWCQDQALNYELGASGLLVDELTVAEVVKNSNNRLIRGGSFADREFYCRASDRDRESPGNRYMTYGFRPVRTIPTR